MSDEFVLDGTPVSTKRPPSVVKDAFKAKNGDTNALRSEMEGYYREMNTLNGLDPMDVFQKLSAFSARASEIRALCFKVDSRQAQALRTQIVDPFLEECDRQFKIHSRLQAIRELEFRLVGQM